MTNIKSGKTFVGNFLLNTLGIIDQIIVLEPFFGHAM